jgi:hypothetical protein
MQDEGGYVSLRLVSVYGFRFDSRWRYHEEPVNVGFFMLLLASVAVLEPSPQDSFLV